MLRIGPSLETIDGSIGSMIDRYRKGDTKGREIRGLVGDLRGMGARADKGKKKERRRRKKKEISIQQLSLFFFVSGETKEVAPFRLFDETIFWIHDARSCINLRHFFRGVSVAVLHADFSWASPFR